MSPYFFGYIKIVCFTTKNIYVIIIQIVFYNFNVVVMLNVGAERGKNGKYGICSKGRSSKGY